MNELMPYIGTIVVIFVAVVALLVLSRHGFRLKKLKHHKTELEFESSSREQTVGTSSNLQPITITKAMIQLGPAAKDDCDTLSISPGEPVDFVLGEATRHPILFNAEFTSLPLVFHENVLLLSWDNSQAKIERILNRKEAYPLNDAWSSCLSLYRQATLLPYRTQGSQKIYTSTEARRVIAVYRRLVSKVEGFLSILRENNQEHPYVYQDVGSLVEEAEIALANEDIGASVARLEVVLSTIHKLILNCAPQGPLSLKVATNSPPEFNITAGDKPTILVVDDNEDWLEMIREYLQESNYGVVSANTTTDALRALVEYEYEVVITDLVMCADFSASPEADGREVAIAAKRSSDKTKVVVITGFPEMSRISDLLKAGVIQVISKARFDKMEFLALIKRLLEKPLTD
jgi:CheY-like chemotaxis protein